MILCLIFQSLSCFSFDLAEYVLEMSKMFARRVNIEQL